MLNNKTTIFFTIIFKLPVPDAWNKKLEGSDNQINTCNNG